MIEPNPQLDLYTIILLTGIIQGLLLSILLIRRGSENSANTILGLLSLSFTLTITEIFLNHTELMLSVIFLYNFSESVQFALGPLLLLYMRRLAGYPPINTKYLHFIPFLLFTCYLIFEFSAPLAQRYNNFLATYKPEVPWISVEKLFDPDPWDLRRPLTTVVIYIHLATYIALSAVAFRSALLKRDSTGRKQWIWNLIIISTIGVLIFLASKTMFAGDIGENIVGIYLTLFIYVIGYFVVKDSPFFKSDKKKYETSSLSPEIAENKHQELSRMMEEEAIYRQDISMKDLAKLVGLTEHHLSQLINEKLGTNFFGLINRYRVQEAKQILEESDSDHLKIEEIGYQVGYNSKSAFYTAFKKEFGTTPQSHRENVRK